MKKEITLNEMKKIELEILTEIDKISRENNLKYSMSDGTMLGAIRHNGFIPWDDDIDIMMPRPDYEKLKSIINSKNNQFYFLSNETDYDYYYPFGKVVNLNTEIKEKKQRKIKKYGVFVDIFPIDGIINDDSYIKKTSRKMKFYRKMLEMSFHDKVDSTSFFKRIIKSILTLFAKMIGTKHWMKCINNITTKFKYEKCNFATMYYSTFFTNKKIVYKKEFFENAIEYDFENKSFLGIKDYNKYLKDLFGNYMELPPSEKQISNHNIEIVNWR